MDEGTKSPGRTDKYDIVIHGCEESTIFEIELTEEEYTAIKRVANESVKCSKYGCMPTMAITKVE